jgi:hypothetical protein
MVTAIPAIPLHDDIPAIGERTMTHLEGKIERLLRYSEPHPFRMVGDPPGIDRSWPKTKERRLYEQAMRSKAPHRPARNRRKQR